MKRVCATDGISCTEDIDHGSWLSYPRNSDLENLRKYIVQLLESTKSDPFIARKLFKIYLDADLDPQVDSYSVCIPMSKHPHNLMTIKMLEILKNDIVDNNLMS